MILDILCGMSMIAIGICIGVVILYIFLVETNADTDERGHLK